MIKRKVLTLLQQHRDDIKRLKVREMFVFGSLARDQVTDSSDIDVLVKFIDPPTFDMYMDLKFFLEDLLGGNIDLVTEDALRPELKDYIKKDLIRVA